MAVTGARMAAESGGDPSWWAAWTSAAMATIGLLLTAIWKASDRQRDRYANLLKELKELEERQSIARHTANGRLETMITAQADRSDRQHSANQKVLGEIREKSADIHARVTVLERLRLETLKRLSGDGT
jgi:hypothetical protein